MKSKAKTMLSGFLAGVPIGLGYFAVSFSLGIVAKNAGLTPFQGLVASFFNLASAGENALFTSIQEGASYAEIAIITFIVNARYLLMSCSLSQKFPRETNVVHRLVVAFAVTDELFGIAYSRPGKLSPLFSYGAMLVAVPLWSLGTYFGIIAGSHLPAPVISALSVSLYGMFIAIIIPPAKKDIAIRIAVAASFVLSFALSVAPLARDLSSGTRTIILTVLISAAAALLRPIKDENPAETEPEQKIEENEK
ncbi:MULTISPECIES: AzlC family ABC transporter permease [Treponema]|nr:MULTISPECIES: AzlC family ABC transporter permease [Treponema]